MRKKTSKDGLTVQAVSGTYVVLLGFNLERANCNGLLGFSIHRTDHEGNTAEYLRGMKCFEATDPGFPSGSSYSSKEHPVQSFGWSDYTVQPGRKYTYVVTALNGVPTALTPLAEVSISITTESPEGGDHDVYFNSGVAGSQAYVRRFGYRAPDKVENNAAFDWLSRGLYEAMTGFVAQATDASFELRVAAYEFHYAPFLRKLAEARNRGVTLKIVYDRRKDNPGARNEEEVEDAGLAPVSTQRTKNKSYISHNKFIVLIKDGQPLAVWTGGTNFSEGGIFGHSNVAHVVEDPAVAQKFLDYWDLLASDPANDDLEPRVEALSPVPAGNTAAAGTTVVFSPRPSLRALEWYRDLAMRATSGLFMTFAFGINELFKDVYRNSTAPLRFALLEKKTRAFDRDEEQARIAEERAIDRLRFDKANVFAIGSIIRDDALEGWVKERLTGLNKNVNYVHNKFMLIDPLSSNPTVIAGSANFSNASTTNNDENMLVIKGNKRVADIYLGEFMRLYSHHAFRESTTFRNANPAPKFLRTDDWWADYFGDTPRSRRRTYFAGAPFEGGA